MNFSYEITLADGKFTFAANGILLDGYIKQALQLGYRPDQIKIEVVVG